MDVSGVHLKVEIQTATTKIPLAEYGGLEKMLKPDEALEGVISHEIKEVTLLFPVANATQDLNYVLYSSTNMC